MTVYGWQAAGIGALILCVAALFWVAMWGWLEFADQTGLPKPLQIGVPLTVIAVGFVIAVSIVGVKL